MIPLLYQQGASPCFFKRADFWRSLTQRPQRARTAAVLRAALLPQPFKHRGAVIDTPAKLVIIMYRFFTIEVTQMTYQMEIAGLTRNLPLCPLNDDLNIGAFVIFGDVELTCACAAELLKIAPDFDYMVAPEAKAIPLVHEMARQSGRNTYFLVRKAPKLYMDGVFAVEDQSITTKGKQMLYMDGTDARKIAGKRILILDDVISTGGSIAAVESLVKQAGGQVVGRMAILAEGKAALRDDILFLKPLPLFDKAGNPLPIE